MIREERIISRIAGELKLAVPQIAKGAALFDEGNTVPFIARYRKEATEGMDNEQLRLLAEKLSLYRNLEKTREDIVRILTEAAALTPELAAAISAAATATELEDIYRPYRPKKRPPPW